MQKKLIKGLALSGLLLLGFCPAVFANSYRVEVLVFAQKLPSNEVFEQTTSTIKPPLEAVEIGYSTDLSRPALAEEPLVGLNAAYEQLSKQADYEILIKKAWQQPINAEQATPAAHIETGDKSLNGYISLITNGAMTMQVDFEYMPEKQNQYTQVMNASPIVYRLTEKRPLKFNESHYFDHPELGVILLITPL